MWPRGKKCFYQIGLITSTLLIVIWFLSNSQSFSAQIRHDQAIQQEPNFQDIVRRVNCSGNGDDQSSRLAQRFLSEDSILRRTESCNAYFEQLSMNRRQTSSEEKAFPIAWTILLHHQVGIFEMFLKLQFRPTDSYCIHVDVKSGEKVLNVVRSIVACYKEWYPDTSIFVPEYRLPVYWGSPSILEAEMHCFRELRKLNKDWKVVLNPAASELPLKTTDEMRSALMQAGKSIIDQYVLPMNHKYRFNRIHRMIRFGNKQFEEKWLPSAQVYPKIPFNVALMKGSKNVALTREFVSFILDSKVAWTFYDWIKSSNIPDEHFYSTLSTFIIGEGEYGQLSVEQQIGVDTTHGLCIRHSDWGQSGCQGQIIRGVCNFARRDLERIRKKTCMMGNKFNLMVDAAAVICQVDYISKITL